MGVPSRKWEQQHVFPRWEVTSLQVEVRAALVRKGQGARTWCTVLPLAKILLSDLIDEFDRSMRSNSYSKNTVRNHVSVARQFLGLVGNIQVQNVSQRHIDTYFASRQACNFAAGTLNTNLSALRALFKHAIHRRYLAAGDDPTAHRRPYRVIRRDRLRIPSSDFPGLLAGCEHPQDRIVVALGLYLFLRRSEIQLSLIHISE